MPKTSSFSPPQAPYGFWEVMEMDSTIFQDLESFGKREVISKWLWKSFGSLLKAILKYPERDIA